MCLTEINQGENVNKNSVVDTQIASSEPLACDTSSKANQ